jgi:hypothetical protein
MATEIERLDGGGKIHFQSKIGRTMIVWMWKSERGKS